MFYLFKLLFILIRIDEETILNWFGVENPTNQSSISQVEEVGYSMAIKTSGIEPSNDVSLETFKLIMQGLWEKIQDGLTLADIENVLFFILFLRFIILAIRYNLKTSFYITCIGLFAGYLWYKHLIDLVSMYRSVLLKLPFLYKLGMDAVQLRSVNSQAVLADVKVEENVHWYNPGQLIYHAFTKGVINIDDETGSQYYIDPVSMVISNLKEPTKSSILPLYYNLYNKIIPSIYKIFSKFWAQLSGIAAYAIITRIGRRYCPYLIRWHWTFLLIIGLVEQIFIYFIYRAYYFQTFVLIPQTKSYSNYVDQSLIFRINSLNLVIGCVVLVHIGFILFGLFHAIWGQYFYLPFFVKNTELHIGPRPKNSIYSGGNTAWQDSNENEQKSKPFLLRFWYGWFGSGIKDGLQINLLLKKWLTNIFTKLKKQF